MKLFRFTTQAILSLLLSFCITCLANAQSKQVQKWEVLDIPITLSGKITNPFQQSVNAIFTHRSGQQKKVPIFYNGNKEWLIRFSASTTGLWTYKTQSDVPALNNHQGQVTVTQAKADNHGAIVINQEYPQHFFYEDGSPYYLLAFELDWLYALDYHNDDGIPKSEHLLSLIKENGFNQVIMSVFSYDVRAEREPSYWRKDPLLKVHPEHEFGAPQDIFPFLGNNENPDYSALNIEFFKKFDRTIRSLHDKRIVAHIMIYVWNKLVSWPKGDSDADNMYFDYVLKRYQAYPNVLWDISKEGLFYDRDEAYIDTRFERLNKLNFAERLVTIHDFGYCNRHPDKVDYISAQDWKWDIYSRMSKIYNKFPNKPIFNIEHGGYDESPYRVFPGNYTDPQVNLRRNWQIIFAGAYSSYYWQAAAWNVIIYNPYQQPESFIKPNFNYYKNIANFFKKYPFNNYIAADNGTGIKYGLKSKDGNTHLLYVHKENFQTSAVRQLFMPKTGIKYEYQWFNTITGAFTEFTEVEADIEYISPWRGQADAILVGRKINL
jgi:hypothetical protein